MRSGKIIGHFIRTAGKVEVVRVHRRIALHDIIAPVEALIAVFGALPVFFQLLFRDVGGDGIVAGIHKAVHFRFGFQAHVFIRVVEHIDETRPVLDAPVGGKVDGTALPEFSSFGLNHHNTVCRANAVYGGGCVFQERNAFDHR